jgi:hypothetical protein
MKFMEENGDCVSPLNPVTLSFRDKGLNKVYAEDYVRKSLNFVRVSLLLAIAMYLLFSFLDPYIMSPEAVDMVMRFRLFGITFFIIGIALTYSDKIKSIYQHVMAGVVLGGGGIIILMIIVSDDSGGSYNYAGLILAVIYAHSLLRLRFIPATLSTWILIVIFEITLFTFSQTPRHIAVNNTFFLVAANILGMFASYGIEYFMKMSFWRNLMLQEKSTLLEVEYERKSNELEDARQVQLSMIPKEVPEHPLYDISFTMKTASEVGGDFFDINLSDDGTITFAVGDATGHGAKAGAMVTAMKFLFSNYAENMDIIDFLKKADHSLNQMHLPRLYMSFMIGKIKGDILEVAGVGMPALTLYNSSSGKLCKLALKGFPLGSGNEFEYKKHSTVLMENDILLVMTDGLPELFNFKQESLEYERIDRKLLKLHSRSSSDILNNIISLADEWRSGFPQHDDITILLIKKKAADTAELINIKAENYDNKNTGIFLQK